tara:strand:+ start:250 stop:369 length:120 start_codon:yes stop_codon:yes gene_type:complete
MAMISNKAKTAPGLTPKMEVDMPPKGREKENRNNSNLVI